jgi:tetratricopeptide (TPR) repeat protein
MEYFLRNFSGKFILVFVFVFCFIPAGYGQAETESSALEKAQRFSEQHDYTSALYWYKKANGLNPDNAMTLYYLAWCYNESGEFSNAVEAAEKGLLLLPSEKLYNELAFGYYSLKNYSKAADNYNLALQLNPVSKIAVKGIANCYFRRQIYDSAAQFYKRRISLDTKDAESYHQLSWIMNEVRDYPKAATYASQAVALNKTYAEAYNEWGFALSRLNKKDSALQYYLKAAQYNPANTDYLFNIADLYFQEGPQKNHEKAILYYRKILETSPENDLVNYRLGWLYNEKMYYKEALTYLDKILTRNPKFAEAWVESGWANLSLNKLEEAESDLQTALLLNKESELAKYYLGQTYIALGNKQKASKILQELKEMKSPYEKKLKAVMSFN